MRGGGGGGDKKEKKRKGELVPPIIWKEEKRPNNSTIKVPLSKSSKERKEGDFGVYSNCQEFRWLKLKTGAACR